MTFAQFIIEHREAAGLTREAVTEALGWSRSYIILIETGRRVPSTAALDRLFEVLLLGPKERSDALRLAAEASVRTDVLTPADEVSTPADSITAA